MSGAVVADLMGFGGAEAPTAGIDEDGSIDRPAVTGEGVLSAIVGCRYESGRET